ncbi:MAG TPA: calcium-binding protein [Mycobacteriales bacterium]|nr:calcium-binding protein [Mycobacteriales bacterium]
MRASAIALTSTVVTGFAVLGPALPAHAAAVTCHGVRATIVGTPGSDVIHGTSHRDVIAGLGGNDTIYAGGGNDLVCGARGADRLYGGPGNDRLYGGKDLVHRPDEGETERVGDTLRGGPGDDLLSAGVDRRTADNLVFDVFSWDQSHRGVHIDMRTGHAHGDGSDVFSGGTYRVVGSSYGDVVDGTDHRDLIETGPGPDVVRARGGNDDIVVDNVHRGPGSNDDRVSGGDGNDRITAGLGEDRLSGGAGNDWIEDLGASNDVLVGGPGDDMLMSEIWDTPDAPQVFNGGRGIDTVQLNTENIDNNQAPATGTWDMATGAMTYNLDHEIDLSAVYIDRIIFDAGGSSWTITGTNAADGVFASATAQTSFDALGGDDQFRGSDGNDTFNGGDGQDHSFLMGDGDDTCISVEQIDGNDCEHVS